MTNVIESFVVSATIPNPTFSRDFASLGSRRWNFEYVYRQLLINHRCTLSSFSLTEQSVYKIHRKPAKKVAPMNE